MAKQQVVTMSPAAHELLVAQVESLPHGMAKPLLLILKSNATPMTIEVPDAPQPTGNTEGGESE